MQAPSSGMFSTPQNFIAPVQNGKQHLSQCELYQYGPSGPSAGMKACIGNVQLSTGLNYKQGQPIRFNVTGQNLRGFGFNVLNVDLRPAGEGAQYIGRNLYEGSNMNVSTDIPLTQAPGLYFVRVNAVIKHCNGKTEILYKDEGPIRVTR